MKPIETVAYWALLALGLLFVLALLLVVPGAMAAPADQVLVTRVLARLPDYAVDSDATVFYAGNPELNGVGRMPATFTPGPRTGPAERPF